MGERRRGREYRGGREGMRGEKKGGERTPCL